MLRLGTFTVISILACAVAAAASATGMLPSWVPLIGCGLILTGLFVGIGLASARPGWAWFGETVVCGTASDHVALTFDDGPNPATTQGILTALGDRHRATFFLLVDQAEAHPELTRAIAAKHQVALHGLHHDFWLTLKSATRGSAELRDARGRLEALIGRPISDYRPPFGAVSPRLYESAHRAGLRVVWCSLRTMDGGSLPEGTLRERLRQAVGGDIILLHEGRPETLSVLPTLLEDLEERSLSSITVEELCQP